MATHCPKCHFENSDTARFCSNCAAPLLPGKESQPSFTKTLETPYQDLTTGSTFADRYQIIEELGKGGMGNVYRALDKELNAEMALKLIEPEIASEEKTIERFKNELKLARNISHRNVGRMYELMEYEGIRFISMEYVPGEDLKSFIHRSGRLDIPKAISIAKQACEGLSEAHRLGVIHRDLKPSNIMIDKEGNVRIMDFGIARSLKTKGITGAGVMIGTPEYMSPEQVEAKDVDQRTDIYSLGVILYEMVVGQLPFEGDTPLSVALKHREERPRDPIELNPQIPEPLNQLILKCLAKEKEKRFQNADDLRTALAGIESEIPTTRKISPKKEPSTIKIGEIKTRKAILYIVAMVAVILLLVFGLPKLMVRQQSFDSIAILPFENISNDPDTAYISDGITESLINHLSQVPNLKVMARYSVFRYKGKETDPQQIGKELQVAAVLAGRVDLRDQSLIIGTDLINVAEGTQIWGERFDRGAIDISNIETEIIAAIIQKLRLQLSQQEMERLSSRHTQDSEAYNLYLKGRYFIYGTRQEMNKALDFFQQAVARDPGFALAYAGIAEAYTTQAFLTTKTREEALPKAKAAVQRALELDETLAEVHTASGDIKYQFDWDWSGAEQEFRRAIELSPGNSVAYMGYATFLLTQDRLEESLINAQKAQELDPLSRGTTHWVAAAYLSMQNYESAASEFQKALDIHPDWHWGYIKLGTTYAAMKKFPEALAEAEKAEKIIGDGGGSLSRAWLAKVYADCGEIERAQNALTQLQQRSRERYVDPWVFAEVYVALGDKEQTLNWLEKAYEERSPSMVYLKTFADSRFKKVSSDPRYQDLLRRMAFK